MFNNIKYQKQYKIIFNHYLSVFFFISFRKRFHQHQYKKIANLIKQRLFYMKYIAKYKFEKHLLIDDIAQENKVILNAFNKAEKFGLDKESIEPFIISQINLAKTIQYRYIKDKLSIVKITTKHNDLEDIRLKLKKLSDDILQLIANELKRNGKMENKIYLYIKKIHLHNLKNIDKKIICSSLKRISLKKKGY